MLREGFVFYRSWAEALEDMPAEEYKACMQALFAYALDGEENPSNAQARMFLRLAKPYVDKNNQRRANGSKGGRPKTEEKPNDNQTVTEPEPKAKQTKGTVTVTVTETVTEKEKNIKEKARFQKPTVGDVRAYCTERGNDINAQAFVDFYEAKGWRIGKEPMKDWKACVRTWEQRPRSPAARQTAKTKFSNFEERSYDFNELEARLLRAQG